MTVRLDRASALLPRVPGAAADGAGALAGLLDLAGGGVHEICEAAHGDMAACAGFALALALRALAGPTRALAPPPRAVAWIAQRSIRAEHGALLEMSVRRVPAGRAAKILHVAATRREEALWAAEEALRSRAARLVVAEIEDWDFTASRRLALASEAAGAPALLISPYRRRGASAAATRWRISSAPSAADPHDAGAPGRPRWRAALERSRRAPMLAGQSFCFEADDETLSLDLTARLAADPAAPADGPQAQGAGGPVLAFPAGGAGLARRRAG